MAANKMKYCPKCKKTRGVSSFQKNASRPDGLQDWCADCSNKQRNLNRGTQKAAKKAAAKSTVTKKDIKALAAHKWTSPARSRYNQTRETINNIRKGSKKNSK